MDISADEADSKKGGTIIGKIVTVFADFAIIAVCVFAIISGYGVVIGITIICVTVLVTIFALLFT